MTAGYSGGEFRAEELPSKAEIQKKIEIVTSSTSTAPGAKPMVIAGLKRQLERAKG